MRLPKQVIILAVLLLVAAGGYFYFRQSFGLNSKISSDEAVAKARASYDETANMECVARWNSQGGYYQVVCNRQNYTLGGSIIEFNYTFYTVSKDGKANKIGNYYKQKGSVPLGKPMWGMK